MSAALFENCMCNCESPDFFVDEVVRARKAHRCEECQRIISPGMRYHSIRGKWNGQIATFKVCMWCESIRTLWTVEMSKYLECGPGIGDLYNFIKEMQ